MATVRTLGLFSLPNLPLGPEERYLLGGVQCPQPSEEFPVVTLDNVSRNIAPANLPQSTYTEVGLNTAMLWLWRVKKFTVSGSIEVEDVNFETTYTVNIGPFELVNYKFNELSAFVSDEKDKVCDCGMFYGNEQSSQFENNEAGSHQARVSIGAIQSMWANYPATPVVNFSGIGQRIRFSQNQASKEFYVPVVVELLVWGGNSLFSWTSGSTTTAQLGQELALSWQIGSLNRAFRFGNDKASGTISIEATEYWPYNPNDGLGPIYNASTGAQLRPFPN